MTLLTAADTATPRTHCGIPIIGLKIANVIAFIVTQLFGYLSARGLISDSSVGAVSRQYPTLITPASGAFGIWAIIYTVEGAFLMAQFWWPKEDEALLLQGVGFWFISACVFNSLWICTFVQSSTAAMWGSTALIFCLLASLCKIYVNTDCWRAARAPGRPLQGVVQTLCLDAHISIYASWVSVATIVNTTIALQTVWTAEPETARACSVVMLVVALLLSAFIVATRRDCVWGWVLAWASFWIDKAEYDDAISITALVVCVCASVASAAVGALVAVRRVKEARAGSASSLSSTRRGEPRPFHN